MHDVLLVNNIVEIQLGMLIVLSRQEQIVDSASLIYFTESIQSIYTSPLTSANHSLINFLMHFGTKNYLNHN